MVGSNLPQGRDNVNLRLKPILTFAAIAVVLALFWEHPLVWPLTIMVVLFHELGHALMAWLTGGEVVSIGLSPDQGGVTYTRGGWRVAILNAGYLGSLTFGGLLLAVARTERGARAAVEALLSASHREDRRRAAEGTFWPQSDPARLASPCSCACYHYGRKTWDQT